MTTAFKASKQIIQTYSAVRLLRKYTHDKLDALLKTNALYILFEPDLRHPYYSLASSGESVVAGFEVFVAGLMDWTLKDGTIKEELDRLKAQQTVNDDQKNDLEALTLLKTSAIDEIEAAKKFLSVCNSVGVVVDKCSKKVLNWEIEKLYTKKYIKRNKESPELKITPECRAVVREVKKLGKVLRDCGNGVSTIRREFEKQQVMLGLTGKKRDLLIEFLLRR